MPSDDHIARTLSHSQHTHHPIAGRYVLHCQHPSKIPIEHFLKGFWPLEDENMLFCRYNSKTWTKTFGLKFRTGITSLLQ